MPFPGMKAVGINILTQKQQAFIEAYTGDGQAAAKAAGYKDNPRSLNLAKVASALLRDPRIKAEIDKRQAVHLIPLIAERVRRQEWWVSVIQDATAEMRDRVKASELLAKSCGDFIEQHFTQNNIAFNPITIVLAADNAPIPLPDNQRDEAEGVVDDAHRLASGKVCIGNGRDR